MVLIRNIISRAERIWMISSKIFLVISTARVEAGEAAFTAAEVPDRRATAASMAFQDQGFDGFGFGQGGNYSSKGSDVQAEIHVTFDEAAFGGKKLIHLQDSTGAVQSYEVNIPAGIETGKSIRLRGKGSPGVSGGEAGDLLLKVTVDEKPGFRREGMDVYTTVQVPFTTAVFGGEVKIRTLTGEVLCKIKPGTQSGTKIRLKGKGIVSLSNSSVHGDQYAVVEIAVPKNLDPEARQKLKEFEAALEKSGRGFHNGNVA